MDSSITHVVFSVSLQCLQAIEIERPSGGVGAASDPGVTWTAFQAGRQVSVPTPQPGQWRLRVAGKGLLFLVVSARASLSLDDPRVVRAGGRPGHEGLFRDHKGLLRDDAPLVPATDRLMEIRISPGILAPTFELRGSPDERLGQLTSQRQPGSDEDQTYLAEFRVPGVPFRVMVTGRDEAGSTVQRVQGSLFELSQPR